MTSVNYSPFVFNRPSRYKNHILSCLATVAPPDNPPPGYRPSNQALLLIKLETPNLSPRQEHNTRRSWIVPTTCISFDWLVQDSLCRTCGGSCLRLVQALYLTICLGFLCPLCQLPLRLPLSDISYRRLACATGQSCVVDFDVLRSLGAGFDVVQFQLIHGREEELRAGIVLS